MPRKNKRNGYVSMLFFEFYLVAYSVIIDPFRLVFQPNDTLAFLRVSYSSASASDAARYQAHFSNVRLTMNEADLRYLTIINRLTPHKCFRAGEPLGTSFQS